MDAEGEFKMVMKNLIRLIVPMLTLFVACGVSCSTSNSYKNTAWEKTENAEQEREKEGDQGTTTGYPIVTAADMGHWASDRSDPFIGIAISGGGSRAANFAAAVLQELDAVGILKHVKAISSVSGGSLVAAYYGLHAPKVAWDVLKSKLRTNFMTAWYFHLLYPHNIALSLLTDFDRSDVMADIFDNTLFDGKTFDAFSANGPRILINATNAMTGRRFVFDNDSFRRLNSRLDSYPIAHAVMASAAFPVIFHNVTLRDYALPWQVGPEDIIDARGLALKLLSADDNVSTYLRSAKIQPETLTKLKANLESPDLERVLRNSVLRKILLGPTLDLQPFKELTLSQETKNLVAQAEKLEIAQIHHLNRLLLGDAYRNELGFPQARYVHLFDGGPVDNLGMDTLVNVARSFFEHASGNDRRERCLLISIDAHAKHSQWHLGLEAETKGFETNLLVASDVLFDQQRSGTFTALGLKRSRVLGKTGDIGWVFGKPLGSYSLNKDLTEPSDTEEGNDIECLVWHIFFDHLHLKRSRIHGVNKQNESESLYPYSSVQTAVSWIETNFNLTGVEGCKSDELQTMLDIAAWGLVHDDAQIEGTLAQWFKGNNIEIDLNRNLKRGKANRSMPVSPPISFGRNGLPRCIH
jgi:hypothetical protein